MPNVPDQNTLLGRISDLIDLARKQVVTTVNLVMVRTYFEIGRMIVEDEQQGRSHAGYGKNVLKDLSTRLTTSFGKGYSEVNLRQMRAFYQTYSIQQTPSAEFQVPHFRLSWSHYLILMRIDNSNERSFYEIESTTNHWSLRELQRQIDSALYERLALSRDKEQIKELGAEGQRVEKP